MKRPLRLPRSDGLGMLFDMPHSAYLTMAGYSESERLEGNP
jgi:hypothetical protein